MWKWQANSYRLINESFPLGVGLVALSGVFWFLSLQKLFYNIIVPPEYTFVVFLLFIFFTSVVFYLTSIVCFFS